MVQDALGLPGFIVEMLESQYASDDVRRIVEGSRVRRRTTLRANTLKGPREAVARAFDDGGIAWDAVSWYADAFVLRDACARDVQAMAAFERGEVYLQSLSSMLPPLVLAPLPHGDVLDMCAAPGGKTTQISALTGGEARITACEMHVPRAERLEFNLARQGARNVTVMRVDARRLDDYFSFDQILVDAPCSGSGTLDVADPKMPKRFTPTLVEKSVKAQRALLAKALRLLKPGGRLVYSTCSVLRRENEDVVGACLKDAGKHGLYRIDPIDAAAFAGLPLLPGALEGALSVCPTELFEGFFVVAIRREA